VKGAVYSTEIVARLKSCSLLSKNTNIKVHRIIILSVVLYGGETWSLNWREEHRLKVLEHRVLRRILGPEGEEVTGKWRKLHKEELNIKILLLKCN